MAGLGLMQKTPLLISNLIEHAAKYHSGAEIVSVIEGVTHRHTWGTVASRSRQMANCLLKVRPSLTVEIQHNPFMPLLQACVSEP